MTRRVPALAAALFALAALALAPWSRDFPLNDDWIYSLPVKNLLEHGTLQLFDTLKTQVLQIGWGWLWAKAFGFSLGALKMSTLCLGAASVWVFAKLLLKLKVEPRAAFLGAFCLAFNPLFFSLSVSFMTEIPYLFMLLLSVWFFAAEEERPAALWASSLSAAGAALIRPTGLLAPAGFSPALLRGRGPVVRKLLIIWLPALAALAGWWLWARAPEASHVSGSALNINSEAFNYWRRPLWVLLETLRRLLSGVFLYGLFLLPFAAVFALRPGFFKGVRENRRAFYIMAAIMILAGFHILLAGRAPLPGNGNSIYRTGLGYVTIYGYTAKASGILGWGIFWPLAAALSMLSAGVLAAEFASLKNLPGAAKTCLIVFALQFAFVLAAPRFFDRYFIYALPAALIAAALAARAIPISAPALFCGGALALFSWAGTADYLAWNGAKWEAAARAAKHGIAPEEVAGGFDYDAWHTYERRMAELKSVKNAAPIGEWDWADLSAKKAAVVFVPPPGSENDVLEKVAYRTPLAPFSRGSVYLLKISFRKTGK